MLRGKLPVFPTDAAYYKLIRSIEKIEKRAKNGTAKPLDKEIAALEAVINSRKGVAIYA